MGAEFSKPASSDCALSGGQGSTAAAAAAPSVARAPAAAAPASWALPAYFTSSASMYDAVTVLTLVGTVLAIQGLSTYLDPYSAQRKQAKAQAKLLRERLGRSLVLNEFEQLLASSVLNPREISVSLDDIGGLANVKRDLRLRVLRPLRGGGLRASLWRPVRGVLLYGPPGTGKTMLAKAVAREADCFFLNITGSTVLSKWFGDANKFVRAIFTLATKLEPCIIFVDEVDAFLAQRGGASEHEATLSAKTEFMQLWDGIESPRGARVLVMGATNRPWCLDEAVLRRFGLQYEVGLPGPDQRRDILSKALSRHEDEMRALREGGALAPGDGGVEAALLRDRPVDGLRGARPGEGALTALARATEGYSGSDLTEVCAQAAQDVLAEMWAAEEEEAAAGAGAAGAGRPEQAPPPGRAPRLRQLRAADVAAALELVKPSTARASRYRNRLAPDAAGGGDDGQQAAAAAAAASAALAAAFGPAGFGAAGGGAGGGAGGPGGSQVPLARLAALLQESALFAEGPGSGLPPAAGYGCNGGGNGSGAGGNGAGVGTA
ncbi:hypothetical protein Rsub_07928 [Raphidocelis subcapitata]|uniref:AAA+ ATPase domain-containing protein n=1 Tax=Raphidocelis subcapitata TaxID=307507 RepID=A0A2V0PBD9_9CHLO|nr:hypothetical protein Rsub_07928 [Raphidocelis subcapitata]|eukprot:GBF95213.1 hypothetical protein Rsub_07928 [Raphidocelis subcapitata]